MEMPSFDLSASLKLSDALKFHPYSCKSDFYVNQPNILELKPQKTHLNLAPFIVPPTFTKCFRCNAKVSLIYCELSLTLFITQHPTIHKS